MTGIAKHEVKDLFHCGLSRKEGKVALNWQCKNMNIEQKDNISINQQ